MLRFSYGAWFGTAGLVAAGARPDDPALRRRGSPPGPARPTGWSETLESNRQRRWVTAARARGADLVGSAVARGMRTARLRGGAPGVLAARAPGRGRPLADQPITGVFNRTCAIHYDIYLRLFPVRAAAGTAS